MTRYVLGFVFDFPKPQPMKEAVDSVSLRNAVVEWYGHWSQLHGKTYRADDPEVSAKHSKLEEAELLLAEMVVSGTPQGEVLLIRKSHPDWMKGKLNGVGGQLREGERPIVAMIRECSEETGLQIGADLWNEFLIMSGDEPNPFQVFCFYAISNRIRDARTPLHGAEPVEIWDVSKLLEFPKQQHQSVANVAWMVTMALRMMSVDKVHMYFVHERR